MLSISYSIKNEYFDILLIEGFYHVLRFLSDEWNSSISSK